jgi:hypothetical protein
MTARERCNGPYSDDMPRYPKFPADYIHLSEGPTNDDKKLSFVAASALSLLCYEGHDVVTEGFRTDDRFRHLQNLLSGVWPVANVASSMLALQPAVYPCTPPLIAWSERLQTLFLGFPGTWSTKDVLSDVNIGQEAEPNLGSRFHAGFYARALQYTTLIEQLAKQYKLVVCGHSLG